MADVPERSLDDLVERLGRAAARRTPFTARIAGGGAFLTFPALLLIGVPAIDANASPRKPSVMTFSRSDSDAILEVAWRASA